MKIGIWARNLSKPMAFPGLICEVKSMSWAAVGGPERAVIRVQGSELGLQPITQLLRCGVTVGDENGLAWWGFVNQVELHNQGCVYVYELGEMANRVAARWRDESPLVGSSGWQWQTAFADDAYSQGQYGVKELVVSMGEGRSGDALLLRDATLAKVKLPVVKTLSPGPAPRAGEGEEGTYVILHCMGWWETLGWRFYGESRGYEGNPDGGILQAVGNVAGNTSVAERMVLGSAGGWDLKEVWIKARTVGAPADALMAMLTNESGGLSGGIGYASGNVLASAMTDNLGWQKFSLTPAYGLAVGTNYWLKFYRTGALDAVNYYQVALDEGLHYPRGILKLWNGGAWVDRSPNADLVFSAFGEEATSTQIANIAASTAGQFLAGVMVKDASGVSSRLYRSGKLSALKEALGLLAMGNASGGRMLAGITPERVLVVRNAPLPGVIDLVIDGQGRVCYRDGRRVMGSDRVAGRWARLAGLPMAGGDAGPNGCVWIERAEWDGEAVRIK